MTKLRQIRIALMGPIQHGKSTLCRNLLLALNQTRWRKSLQLDGPQAPSDFSAELYRFAGPLKAMLRELGIDPDGDKDAKPPVLCGRTVRYALQTLGTEWGRETIHQDLWCRCVIDKIIRDQCAIALLDDLRFPNEAAVLVQNEFKLFRIFRPAGPRPDPSHPSEAYYDAITRKFDVPTISVEEGQDGIQKAIETILSYFH